MFFKKKNKKHHTVPVDSNHIISPNDIKFVNVTPFIPDNGTCPECGCPEDHMFPVGIGRDEVEVYPPLPPRANEVEDIDIYMEDLMNENDSYIEPSLLYLRDKFEGDSINPELQAWAKYARTVNAKTSKKLADDMANVYRAHLATIMEMNTQVMLHSFEDQYNYINRAVIAAFDDNKKIF